jgi:novobiocin biosynthesis protein NovI
MTARPVLDPSELEKVDLNDPRLHAEFDLSELWRHLREERPYYRQDERGDQPAFWVLSRYADIVRVYRDADRFSAERGNALNTLLTGGDPASRKMLAVTDGLRHSQVRKIMMTAFSPRVLNEIGKSIERTVEALMARALERRDCDFARDVAAEVPLTAICDLLDIPTEDRAYLLGLTARVLSSDEADAPADDSRTAKNEILLYFADLAETRRNSGQEDVVSLLTDCTIEGEPLSEAELITNCYGLMIGGDETGRHAITCGLMALMEYPDQWRAFKAGEAEIGTAVEEVLRWTVPGLQGARTTVEDTVVGEGRFQTGDIVSVWFNSANRDPAVFPEPDRFDLNRSPNKHLTFAFGPHYCLGHFLARLEVKAVLNALHRLVAGMEQTGPERRIYSSVLSGVSSLPVRLHPE